MLLSICLAAPAGAQSDWSERVIDAYQHPAPIDTQPLPDASEAVAIQNRVIKALEPGLGGVFGYKAGLTSPAARERFNVDEPILGALLTGMIRESGAAISVASGVNLLVEGDLLVRVRDARINDAETRADAFAAIDRVAPFLEVPDVIIARGQPINGPVLTAVNSGARWGVMGPVIDIASLTPDALADFHLLLDRDGETIGESTGRALMEDPLNVVLWMVGEARNRGIKLKAGDWLSLGSLTPPMPVQAGERYTATYTGLGMQAIEIEVGFTP